MTSKVKSLFTVVSEAIETAAGYAFIAVGIGAVLFVDITGGGSLWKTAGHLISQKRIESPNAIRMIKVPTQPLVEKVEGDRLLVVADAPETDVAAAAHYAPEAAGRRPAAALTDAPADPKSGKSWKRGLQGQLRTFTVYGNGEQTTSASSMSAPPVLGSAEPELPVVPAEGSAAKAETAAAARPGMSSRLSRGALSASGSSRNAR